MRGMGWRHFPIRDYGAPQTAESRWPPLSVELHATLAAGGSVLLHCAGGCGRSGMVALRLFAESGVAPAEALALIRSIRPCAVETAEQEAWGAAGWAKR
jgi:protein-tyrosine phosphatase